VLDSVQRQSVVDMTVVDTDISWCVKYGRGGFFQWNKFLSTGIIQKSSRLMEEGKGPHRREGKMGGVSEAPASIALSRSASRDYLFSETNTENHF
jgi:hypothetical protein